MSKQLYTYFDKTLPLYKKMQLISSSPSFTIMIYPCPLCVVSTYKTKTKTSQSSISYHPKINDSSVNVINSNSFFTFDILPLFQLWCYLTLGICCYFYCCFSFFIYYLLFTIIMPTSSSFSSFYILLLPFAPFTFMILCPASVVSIPPSKSWWCA